MDTNLTPSDIKAVMGDDFGSNGSWWIIILFIFLFGVNGGGWGNNGAAYATAEDIQRAVDLNSIQEGQAEINANIQRGIYEINGATKDAAYNNLSEIRDTQAMNAAGFAGIQEALTVGFGNMQKNSCETLRAIDSVNYNAAMNTAAINSNIDAKFAALEKGQLEQQIAAQQAQISQLQLQSAMCGVVRYPQATTYTAGTGPFCNCGGCGCGTTF